MNPVKVPFYAKSTLILIGLYVFINILYITQDIIVPIIGSIIIAVVLSPIVDFFVKKKMNRVIAISIVITFFSAIVVLTVLLLSSQISAFASSIPKLIDKFYSALNESVLWSSRKFNVSTETINKFIADTKGEITNSSSTIISNTITSMGSILFTLVLIPVYVFMMLYYKSLMLDFIHKVFGRSNNLEVNNILSSTKVIIQRYLIALLLEAVVIAVLNSIGLLIIGIDYAIILGIIGAVLNVIPYIGGVVSTAIPMMVAFATKDSFSYSLYVLLAYTIIQLIDNNFVLPKLVASKVSINALISVVAVIVGGEIWGVPGMFLSIPLVAIIKVICDNIDSLKPWGLLLGDRLPTTRKQ